MAADHPAEQMTDAKAGYIHITPRLNLDHWQGKQHHNKLFHIHPKKATSDEKCMEECVRVALLVCIIWLCGTICLLWPIPGSARANYTGPGQPPAHAQQLVPGRVQGHATIQTGS